jgi:hypothetical protein
MFLMLLPELYWHTPIAFTLQCGTGFLLAARVCSPHVLLLYSVWFLQQ